MSCKSESESSSSTSLIGDLGHCAERMKDAISSSQKSANASMTQIRYNPDCHRQRLHIVNSFLKSSEEKAANFETEIENEYEDTEAKVQNYINIKVPTASASKMEGDDFNSDSDSSTDSFLKSLQEEYKAVRSSTDSYLRNMKDKPQERQKTRRIDSKPLKPRLSSPRSETRKLFAEYYGLSTSEDENDHSFSTSSTISRHSQRSAAVNSVKSDSGIMRTSRKMSKSATKKNKSCDLNTSLTSTRSLRFTRTRSSERLKGSKSRKNGLSYRRPQTSSLKKNVSATKAPLRNRTKRKSASKRRNPDIYVNSHIRKSINSRTKNINSKSTSSSTKRINSTTGPIRIRNGEIRTKSNAISKFKGVPSQSQGKTRAISELKRKNMEIEKECQKLLEENGKLKTKLQQKMVQLRESKRKQRAPQAEILKLKKAIEDQFVQTNLWMARAKKAHEQLQRSKQKKSAGLSDSPMLRKLKHDHSSLSKSHDLALNELRSTKAEVNELSKSLKMLKHALEESEKARLDTQRQLQLEKLKATHQARKTTERFENAVIPVASRSFRNGSLGTNSRIETTTPSPYKRFYFGTNSGERRKSSSSLSLDSLSFANQQDTIENLHSTASTSLLNQSVRSEPSKNLAAYDRYKKLKNMYNERYASSKE